MKIFFVVGTRPNLIKIAPLLRASQEGIEYKLVHVGQHYDWNMSKVFFEELGLPEPDINLGIGSGTHAKQTSKAMIGFEKYCIKESPDVVVVVGDVNSTLGCALAVAKLDGIKLAHVEAGCRAVMNSPEGINRRLVDVVSDYLFCPSERDLANLKSENLTGTVVGDVAIDTLIRMMPKAKAPDIPKPYALLTLHRPVNVDDPEKLEQILKSINKIAEDIDIVSRVHPRTMNKINEFGFQDYLKRLKTYPPAGYLELLGLLMNAKFLITDSGGLQIEASYLNIPCLSLIESTGHVDTLFNGTNTLVSADTIVEESQKIISGNGKYMAEMPKLWDGKTAERIISVIKEGKI